MKYQIRKFTVKFSKTRAKEERKQKQEFETTVKIPRKPLSTEENQCLYDKCKRDLEEIYDNIVEDIRIRRRYQWYEEGKKSSKLNPEKCMQSHRITDPNKIKNEIKNFYECLFKTVNSKPPSQINDFHNKVQLAKLNVIEINECNNDLSEEELYKTFRILQMNESSGNDGLEKKCFVTFRDDIKVVFLNSCRIAKLENELSTLQRQTIIKLIEKKIRILDLFNIGEQILY